MLIREFTLIDRDIERFHQKYTRGGKSSCWLWEGDTNKDGYGRFKVKGKVVLAHRIAFFLHYDQMPVLLVRHSCDTPGCVNPHHLSEGTQLDNMQDAVSKGRMRSYFKPGVYWKDEYQRKHGYSHG